MTVALSCSAEGTNTGIIGGAHSKGNELDDLSTGMARNYNLLRIDTDDERPLW